MIGITVVLFLLHHVNNSFCTRLPLEIYELPQHQQHQHQQQHHQQIQSQQHQHQSTQVYNSGPPTSSSSSSSISPSSNYIKHKSIYNHHAERRRSRQMLDALQQQQPYQHEGITRILYQVGETETDLPICTPNAVCSKIDLYETPWIERQCRCPETASLIHHKGHQVNNHNDDDDEKYQEILGGEKSHRRLLNGDDDGFNDDTNSKHIDSIHLKKLMQKLGAVYQDDILLDINDLDEEQKITNSFHSGSNHRLGGGGGGGGGGEEYAIGNHKNFIVSSKSAHAGGGDGGGSGGGDDGDLSKLRHSGRRKDIPTIGGCPSSLSANDGHTIADKTRHYKLCNSVHKLPLCRYFRDYTWTLSTSPEINVTEQIVHCRCPKNSVTYLTKREPLATGRAGYSYLFACSPQSRLRCQRKEPCKLFTIRKRQEFLDEVNTNPLCQCPKGHRCPKHHTEPGVIAGKSFIEDNIQTYSGYCMAND